VSPFNIETGESLSSLPDGIKSWSDTLGSYLIEYATNNPKFTVVVPAMIAGSGLLDYKKVHPDRVIDVGIAEQMAVTMASGFAVQDVDVFLPIYSTFLQRAYDQVNHDVARQNLKVVFGIERAGIVGADGETHQGVFDIPLLRHIPNMKIAHPRNQEEAYQILNYAFKENKGPIAVRYERGSTAFNDELIKTSKIATTSWDVLQEGKDVSFVSFGSILDQVMEQSKKRKYKHGSNKRQVY
jgi:1-deoxy-D-xylulose-5-phosphate synthase